MPWNWWQTTGKYVRKFDEKILFFKTITVAKWEFFPGTQGSVSHIFWLSWQKYRALGDQSDGDYKRFNRHKIGERRGERRGLVYPPVNIYSSTHVMVASLVMLRGRDRVWPRAGEVDGPWPHEAGVTPLRSGLMTPGLHVTAAAALGLAPVPVGVSLRDAVPVRLVLEISTWITRDKSILSLVPQCTIVPKYDLA